MKLFVTSDLHGNKELFDSLQRAAGPADALMICGDVGGKGRRIRKIEEFSVIQKKDAEYLAGILEKTGKPGRFILGNDDWFEYDSPYHLTLPQVIGGERFIPFEYVLTTPFQTNREVNEFRMDYELRKLDADRNSVIIAHTPPYYAGDLVYSGERAGSQTLREWIIDVQPKLWCCGHIHENFSASYIGETLVLNCSSSYNDGILRGWLVDTETLEHQPVII